MTAPLFSRENPGTLRDLMGAICGPQAVTEYDARERFDAAKHALIVARMRAPCESDNLPALLAACQDAYRRMWAARGETDRTLPEWLQEAR